MDNIKMETDSIADRNEAVAFVFKREREKLSGTVLKDFVFAFRSNGIACGFDVISFTPDGDPIFIKTTVSDSRNDPFRMTDFEYQFAERSFEIDALYQIHHVYGLKSGKPDVEIIYADDLMVRYDSTPSSYIISKCTHPKY